MSDKVRHAERAQKSTHHAQSKAIQERMRNKVIEMSGKGHNAISKALGLGVRGIIYKWRTIAHIGEPSQEWPVYQNYFKSIPHPGTLQKYFFTTLYICTDTFSPEKHF